MPGVPRPHVENAVRIRSAQRAAGTKQDKITPRCVVRG